MIFVTGFTKAETLGCLIDCGIEVEGDFPLETLKSALRYDSYSFSAVSFGSSFFVCCFAEVCFMNVSDNEKEPLRREGALDTGGL